MSGKSLTLPFLETMITQVCNLSCQGCTNYSDIDHRGYVSWAEGKKTLESWLRILDIEDFGIIGGEPLINPQWREWILGIRDMMPTTQIRFTTNGLLLHRAQDILDIMEHVGNVVFKITVHVNRPELEQQISEIMQARQWHAVQEHGIHRWTTGNRVRLQINRPAAFIKTFRGSYQDMRPYHSNPHDAFAICCQQTCPLLYKGKLFKCSTSGLLKDVLERFGNPNFDEWQRYIMHGVSPTDHSDKIKDFVANFGHSSPICAQCPGSNKSQIDHVSAVWIKKPVHKSEII